ncbi:MAG: di-trans,poly-cis-decaprenylcistransferase [Candidatus Diapherotrites archaeon]|uniref:Tritrans,polycis-undecaprenyl-diphosphate synthase (geranylgeranyl-diphosphate specific) n=1 Tax=Candidatus Iainarchaeum sp. TaxID=3101447 RepID=A0A2D6M085_9ARCH|nr:di-trans,poly-cis-decaprenylcistransferase [Candidatus Diapherotrites archaeon]|tara:strand:+ start:3234 stop:3929 length:696 start_codon:yes stop_codon:yes gene_type:complete
MSLERIAFIPDGNRRYARKVGISYAKAYQMGTRKAWDVIDWMCEYPKIKAGTFYTLSLENLSRSKLELKVLMKIFERELDKVKTKKVFEEQGIKLRFLGRLGALPNGIQKKIKEVEDYTSEFDEKEVNLALGYNGRAEIVDAAKKFAEECKKGETTLDNLDETSFGEYLYSSNSPDLIVRTSGTQRLSGFLTYQSAYSEFHFTQKYWPEFEQQDLDTAVHEFDARERRFGK